MIRGGLAPRTARHASMLLGAAGVLCACRATHHLKGGHPLRAAGDLLGALLVTSGMLLMEAHIPNEVDAIASAVAKIPAARRHDLLVYLRYDARKLQ